MKRICHGSPDVVTGHGCDVLNVVYNAQRACAKAWDFAWWRRERLMARARALPT